MLINDDHYWLNAILRHLLQCIEWFVVFMSYKPSGNPLVHCNKAICYYGQLCLIISSSKCDKFAGMLIIPRVWFGVNILLSFFFFF